MTNVALEHKEKTLQDLLDEMTPEQKELQALIVGAAVEGESLEGNDDVAADYIALPDEQKHLIDFIVGNTLAEKALNHSDIDEVGDFLAHFGVKGMKWGVVKSRVNGVRDSINAPGSLSRSSSNTSQARLAARTAVKGGNATRKESHVAALKSTGHRAVNALSGDSTFWRRMAITTGITTAAVGIPIAGAWLLPAGVLGALGGSAVGAALSGASSTPALASTMTAVELGQWAMAGLGVKAGIVTAYTGTAANVVGNTGRAVAGNTIINKSYARLGKEMQTRQRTGRQKVANVLKTVGGVRDIDLKHTNDLVDNFLAQHASSKVVRHD